MTLLNCNEASFSSDTEAQDAHQSNSLRPEATAKRFSNRFVQSVRAQTRALLIDEADALDGAILLKLPSQLLLCGIVADAPHKECFEWVALHLQEFCS